MGKGHLLPFEPGPRLDILTGLSVDFAALSESSASV